MSEIEGKELVFNRIFREYGGLYRMKEQDVRLQYYLNHMRETIQVWQMEYPGYPDVYINYINDLQLNAHAAVKDGQYYIGIHVGTIEVFWFFFSRVLRSPELLKDFGDASKEFGVERIFNAEQTSVTSIYLATVPYEYIEPVCTKRKAFEQVLCIHALNFLLAHEYGHVVNGHCDYSSALESGFKFFESLEVLREGPLSPIDRQTLEIDADKFAVHHSLLLLRMQLSYRMYGVEIADLADDHKKAHYLWWFALYSFWRLCAFTNYELGGENLHSHPPPVMRQRLAIFHSKKLFHHFNGAEAEAFFDALIDAAFEVELAFYLLGEQGFKLNRAMFNDTEEVLKYTLKLLKNWNIVRPKLDPHSHAILQRLNDVEGIAQQFFG